MREHQKAELIQQVQMLAEELGRTPTANEFNKDPRTVSTSAVINRFGSWNKFLEAAGLEVNKKRSEISGEELIQQVQMLAEELGRTPTTGEFNKDPRTVSSNTAQYHFGSWNKFLEAAGLEVNLIMDDDLIEQIQMLARELGRTPKIREFKNDPRTASPSTAQYHFGSWNRCIEAAGLEVYQKRGIISSEEQLVQQVQMLAEELGRAPTMREFDKDPRTASTSAVINRFGSWNKFLEAAGLEVYQKRGIISSEELIQQVQMLAEELGRTPTANEFNKDPRTVSTSAVINRFGSWNKFLEAAGLKINEKRG